MQLRGWIKSIQEAVRRLYRPYSLYWAGLGWERRDVSHEKLSKRDCKTAPPLSRSCNDSVGLVILITRILCTYSQSRKNK